MHNPTSGYVDGIYSEVVVVVAWVTGELYHGETLQLMLNRWKKLEKDFKQNHGRFDISKIPDIYDCIKYDLLHNR